MSIRRFTIFALALIHQLGFAFPLVRPPCDESSYNRGLRDLVHKIGVMGVDDRKSASELVQRGVISKSEYANILMATGSIHCPVKVKGEKGKFVELWNTGSAALVEDDQTLITSGHAFFHPEEATPLKELSRCFFENRAGKRVLLKLKDGLIPAGLEAARRAGYLVLGTDRPFDDDQANNDRAVVRLAEPIKGAKGFKVDASEGALKSRELINISVVQKDMAESTTGLKFSRDLVGQVCARHALIPAQGVGATQMLKIDCDSMGQGSGSILLTRTQRDGPLVAVGVVIGATDLAPGSPFSIDSNYTLAVAVDSSFVEEITWIKRKDRLMNTASVSN